MENRLELHIDHNIEVMSRNLVMKSMKIDKIPKDSLQEEVALLKNSSLVRSISTFSMLQRTEKRSDLLVLKPIV